MVSRKVPRLSLKRNKISPVNEIFHILFKFGFLHYEAEPLGMMAAIVLVLPILKSNTEILFLKTVQYCLSTIPSEFDLRV